MDEHNDNVSLINVSPKIDIDDGDAPHYDRQVSQFLYCLVFPVDTKKLSDEELKEQRQKILDTIVDAGLDVELFYSVQEDEVFCKVGASDNRLLLEADAIGYKLELEPRSMKVLAEGDKDECRAPVRLEPPYSRDERFEKQSMMGSWEKLDDEEILPFIQAQTSLAPFEQLYARYNDEWEEYAQATYGVCLYRLQPNGSILRNADRMKLIRSILERSTNEHPVNHTRGAGLDLGKLLMSKALLAEFPLQTAQTSLNAHELSIDQLSDMWKQNPFRPWRQPLLEIRDYFGEKVAFYFAFLGHYTLWLTIPAVVGLGIFGHQMYVVAKNNKSFLDPSELSEVSENVYEAEVYTEVPEAPVFALFISIWATVLMEFWKRKQARLALRWGMVEFESDESARVEFKPTHFLPSPVTGRSTSYYSDFNFMVKLAGSFSVLLFCIGVVFAAIAAILILKVVFAQLDASGITGQVVPQLALVVNAVVIQILGALYKTVAKKLNDWENHRTDTQYEDNLILKSFAFNFVNSYTTLAYIAFVKSGTKIIGVEQYCIPTIGDERTEEVVADIGNATVADACFGGLGYSLLIIFGTQLVVNNTLEVIIPTITSYLTKRSNLKETTNGKSELAKARESGDFEKADQMSVKLERIKTKSPAEDQFFLKTYEGTFADFLEIALQFGYVTLFVTAFPLAPFLALLNNLVEFRVDSFKLCKLCRRPEMRSAEDIGTWYGIYATVGSIAVLTNAAVVCFTSNNLLPDLSEVVDIEEETARVWFFILFVTVVLVIKWVIGAVITDIPPEVQIQKERNEYLIRKCLIREKDDEVADVSHNHVAKRNEYVIAYQDPTIENLLEQVASLIKDVNVGQSIREMFQNADANGSGEISVAEFSETLKSSGGIAEKLTDSEIEILVHALDNNGNGQIDYKEFSDLMKLSV